jgi:hypothetical protein
MASFAVFSFAVDETSTEMYKPGIEPQEHYYSRNRHYHCIHTRVVMTNHNVLCRILVSCDIRSMPSSLCLRWIGIDLPFPDDLYLLWDKIYPNRHPIMTPYTRQMIVLEPANLQNEQTYHRIPHYGRTCYMWSKTLQCTWHVLEIHETTPKTSCRKMSCIFCRRKQLI